LTEKIKKVVLAYSGGLDTSVILKWLIETYQCEVVTFSADIGQEDDFDQIRENARKTGASKIYIEDLKEIFVRDYVFPAFRANAIYEGQYLLGTSLARPLIAKRQVEIAELEGADAVSHGATGKGNDQVRFELGYLAHEPHIKIVAPWPTRNLTAPIPTCSTSAMKAACLKIRGKPLPRTFTPLRCHRATRPTHPRTSK
jgi:argininosuccinate synthase